MKVRWGIPPSVVFFKTKYKRTQFIGSNKTVDFRKDRKRSNGTAHQDYRGQDSSRRASEGMEQEVGGGRR
jgi:hypothetical protein